jgi:predicted nucleic acid-binding protein
MMRRALLDNSAWARLRPPSSVPAPRRAEVARAIEAGDVFVCLPFLLEACYSARNAMEHDELLCELEALPHLEIDSAVERRTLDAQAQLARVGHHRLPPVDLMLAAVADRHQMDILHYDADYDLIANKTDLAFRSVWLAKRGSL